MRFGKKLLLATLLVCPSARSEEPLPDYSDGLDRLGELGLPEMKGAQWVKLPGDFDRAFTASYEFRELEIRMSGNAWKLVSPESVFLDFGSAAVLEAPSENEEKSDSEEAEEKPGILGKMLRNYQKENPEPEKKTPPPEPESLASGDAKKIVAALAKPSVAEEIENSMSWGNSALPGRLLLFAAQIRSSGDPASANLLANALFQTVTNDEALIDQAVGHLADTAYTLAANRFFEDYDWDAYLASCRALLEKYPRGWANAPAIALLVSKLEKRGTAPPAKPALPGIELNPEALSLIDRMMEKSDGKATDEQLARAGGVDLSEYPANQRAQIIAMLRREGMGVSYENTGLWLLPEDGAKPDQSPLASLQTMGMDSVIALAAIATDETLVPVRKSSDGGSNYYSSNESPAESIRKRYQNLDRPTTRGEIAAGLLTGVVPVQEDEFGGNQTDPESLAAAALDFWKSNHGKSPVELAVLYVREGNDSQQSQASTWLSASKDPAANAAFEAAVLASDDPLELISEVDQYLSRRKTAAKPFADAYVKLLRENPPDDERLGSTSGGYLIREAGGLENYLKKLSLSVGDISLKKLIAKAIKEEPGFAPEGENEQKSPVAALASTIQGIALEECLREFGNVASVATPEQWMEIHQLLLNRIYYELRSSGGPEETTFTPLSEKVLAVWKPLIDRAEALPESGDYPDYVRAYGGKTAGDGSALILELATNPGLAYSFNSYAQIESSPSAVMEFVRKRVDAWTDGKDPEPWPAAASVSDERRTEISEKLATLPAAEITPFAGSLPPGERLALMEIIGSYDESNPAPPGLMELRQTIVSLAPLFASGHDAEAAAKLGIAVGEQITPELLTRISDDLLNDAAARSATTVMFYPAAMNLGTTLYVLTAADLDPKKVRTSGLSNLARLFETFGNRPALSAIHFGNVADMLALENGKPVTLESEGSALTDFTKALEAKTAVLPPIRISVLTLEDAEKINNQDR